MTTWNTNLILNNLIATGLTNPLNANVVGNGNYIAGCDAPPFGTSAIVCRETGTFLIEDTVNNPLLLVSNTGLVLGGAIPHTVTVRAPTVSPSTDNSTLVATTAFVQSAIAGASSNATTITTANNNTNATFYPTFVGAVGAGQSVFVDSVSNPLSYNPFTGALAATTFVGALTGNAATSTTATNLTNGSIFTTKTTTGSISGASITAPDRAYSITNASSPVILTIGGVLSSLPTSYTAFVSSLISPTLDINGDDNTWTSRTSQFGTFSQINSVGFGVGLFVAVGGNGSLSTSTDGINWTARTSALTSAIQAVGTGVGGGTVRYVVGGQLGGLASSPDGTTWTARTSQFGVNIINTIGFGAGLFIAMGNTGINSTSPDGITWTLRTALAQPIQSVAFGAGLFVAVGGLGYLVTSPDGINWTVRTSNVPATVTIQSVAFGAGLFVAVALGGTIVSSPDGITWTVRFSTPGFNFQSVAYNSTTGAWIALNNSVGALNYSLDGLTWLTRSAFLTDSLVIPNFQVMTRIAFGVGTFVATGTNGALQNSSTSLKCQITPVTLHLA